MGEDTGSRPGRVPVHFRQKSSLQMRHREAKPGANTGGKVNQLHIAPNRPVFVALKDPEGVFDQELNRGTYQTTAGEELILPRPAVVALNMVGPAPGEEIEILQT